MYAKMTHIHISYDRGYMKEKTPGISLMGFLNIMLIPKLMKGLLKSITLSRTEVIVNGAIARSASYKCKIVSHHWYQSQSGYIKCGGTTKVKDWRLQISMILDITE